MRQNSSLTDCQRVQVTRETQGAEQVLRISVERHDEALGWYAAGSLCLPVCQLPLLQQALDDLSAASDCLNCTGAACSRKIIPFPTMAGNGMDEALAETGA